MTAHLAAMLLAMALDALLGWPRRLHALIGHPVGWLGALIALGDRSLNREGASFAVRRIAGLLLALAIIALAAGVGLALSQALTGGWFKVVMTGILVWPLLAVRSMHAHVANVAKPLGRGDMAEARYAVAMIVGRDPSQLDAAGIARAAAESLAENTSDGIIAPLFWGIIFGLPGIAAYKAINTMDSMIGYRTARYGAFGWAAARIDDLANIVPARLTGLLFALVSTRPARALSVMWRDAGQHRSPNAGWPESAFAGALDIRLSGPRIYADKVSDEPWLNGEARDPGAVDIDLGLILYRRAMMLAASVMALLAISGAVS
ncbi:adenosylcobinamide-phosphate synthase CbiB [Aquisediminimonas sediminicola]|uniref:adenosylcobinamide-phosphate synthase CbiB n=1 Tax=Alteraquisediminimonas sediminicola TaxID=2676787 RepID=UPI001C8DFBB4|nr:adenosylcobinamide-phosphate synthase CbiB [Aquisediminimonas sediminicola]